jgi:hypothetical protein
MKREPRMPKEVFKALGELLQEFGDVDLEERLAYFDEKEETDPEKFTGKHEAFLRRGR